MERKYNVPTEDWRWDSATEHVTIDGSSLDNNGFSLYIKCEKFRWEKILVDLFHWNFFSLMFFSLKIFASM